MKNLKGTVCIITGGSSGIGEAIARNLLEIGVNIFDFSRTNKLTDKIKDQPDNLYSFLGDVGSEIDVKKAFQQCFKIFGTVDYLINNAGIGIQTPNLSEATTDVYNRIMDTNVRGVFLCTREALKIMKPRKKGHIITVISMAGQRTNPVAPLYVASKFGARGLNGAVADQVLKDGIKVTDLNPGPVDTNYWGDRDVPRESFLSAEDVARVAIFVLSLPDRVLIREINMDHMNFFKNN